MKFKDIISTLPEKEKTELKQWMKGFSRLVFAFIGLSFFTIFGIILSQYIQGCK